MKDRLAQMWKTFGRQMRSRRKELGKTQEQCALEAGIERQRWLQIESGQPTKPSTVLRIAKALNLPGDEALRLTRLPESSSALAAGGASAVTRLVGFYSELSPESQADVLAIIEVLWKLHRIT